MKIIVDRIEENIAVVELENGKMLNVPLEIIADANEGDSIILSVENKAESITTDTHSIFEKLRNKSKADI